MKEISQRLRCHLGRLVVALPSAEKGRFSSTEQSRVPRPLCGLCGLKSETQGSLSSVANLRRPRNVQQQKSSVCHGIKWKKNKKIPDSRISGDFGGLRPAIEYGTADEGVNYSSGRRKFVSWIRAHYSADGKHLNGQSDGYVFPLVFISFIQMYSSS